MTGPASRDGFLRVEGLSKDFGGVRALEDVSMALGEGGVLCIVGPNGCGKTTLFNLITGALRPTSGRVSFRGRDITELAPHRISRMGIGRKFQVPAIYPELSVLENLEVPLFSESGDRAWLRRLRPSALVAEAETLLEDFGLGGREDALAGTLSHGEQQWLEIAMVLARRPRLVLLDEPTSGMTLGETQATVALVRRIARERGVSFIIIEHDMAFVRELGSEIVVLVKGRIVCRGSYHEVRDNPIVREAYLGRAA